MQRRACQLLPLMWVQLLRAFLQEARLSSSQAQPHQTTCHPTDQPRGRHARRTLLNRLLDLQLLILLLLLALARRPHQLLGRELQVEDLVQQLRQGSEGTRALEQQGAAVVGLGGVGGSGGGGTWGLPRPEQAPKYSTLSLVLNMARPLLLGGRAVRNRRLWRSAGVLGADEGVG